MPGRALLGIIVVLAVACRREPSTFDDVQKMAYGVKPAVVRVSALATAEFRYPETALQAVEDALALAAGDAIDGHGVVETGAGGSGSGFIIHPDGFILTSGHVVAPTRDAPRLDAELRRHGALAALMRHFPVGELRALQQSDDLDRFVAMLAAEGSIANKRVVHQVELSNGERLSFTLRGYSPSVAEGGRDLAVVKVERRNLPAVVLADSDTIGVGQPIWTFGYPAVASTGDAVIGGWLSSDSDLEATVNNGIITALKVDKIKTPVFQSDVAIYVGNSGGPAVNQRGEVIGISSWGHTKADIKFLVPINVARQFLAEAKVPAGAGGEFNDHYRAALEAAKEGNWVDAKVELINATRLFPNSPDLIRFGRDAERAIRQTPLWRLHPVASGIAGVVLLSVVLMMTMIVVRSRAPRVAMPGVLVPPMTVETLVAPNGANGQQAMLGKFTILNGQRAGEKLGLGGSGIRIGRESEICEIVLANPKVSRLHAEVVSIDGKVLLIDRNSSNGTYVNDQKIDKRFLQDGDIIYFGGRNAVAVAFHA